MTNDEASANRPADAQPAASAAPDAAQRNRFRLCGDEVDVWHARLDLQQVRLVMLERCLSPDERERAARFRFPRDRERFVAARGTLRAILGAYLGKPAGEVALACGPNGKPHVAASERSDVQFNLAHSRDLALFALAAGRAVGVDVEFVNPDLPFLDSAPAVCSTREIAELRRLDPDAARVRFFKIWTAKEARLKASGEGFSADAASLEVGFRDGAAVSIARYGAPVTSAARDRGGFFHAEDSPSDGTPWTLREIPCDGFAAALVVAGAGATLRYFDSEILPPPGVRGARAD
jgi:4'-phosphopantetheinyl transferase